MLQCSSHNSVLAETLVRQLTGQSFLGLNASPKAYLLTQGGIPPRTACKQWLIGGQGIRTGPSSPYMSSGSLFKPGICFSLIPVLLHPLAQLVSPRPHSQHSLHLTEQLRRCCLDSSVCNIDFFQIHLPCCSPISGFEIDIIICTHLCLKSVFRTDLIKLNSSFGTQV